MSFDVTAFQTGALHFGLAFLAACGFALMFMAVYRLITPHDEGKLIREGNVAAAIALGGALIGYVLPLASALSNTEALPEFVAWAALAGVIQVVTFWIMLHVGLKGLSDKIEQGDVAAAVYMMMVSIAVGLINAACMTA